MSDFCWFLRRPDRSLPEARQKMASDQNGGRRLHAGTRAALACLTGLPPLRRLAAPLSLLCLAATAQAAGGVADALHRSVMDMRPRYQQYSEQKALAGCFDWQRSTPADPDVQYLAVATFSKRGQRSLSIGRLASNVLDRCQRIRESNQTACDCQVIDRNGKNALDPPDDFLHRLQ